MTGKLPGYHVNAEQDLSAHHFEAEGEAPFVKLPKGALVRWKFAWPIEIETSGGLLGVKSSIFTLGKGTFRIIPLARSEMQVEYDSPLYLLSYVKLAETLMHRYEFDLWLAPEWRENLWPYLLRCYLRTGQWPTGLRDYARFFQRILKHADVARIAESKSDTLIKRFRKGFVLAALTRLGRNQSARMLALAHAEEITRKLVDSEYYLGMLAEVNAFRSIERRQSIVPLVGEYFEDELRLKIPFEIPPAKSVVVADQCTVQFMWEYGEKFDAPRLCSSVELLPKNPMVLSNRVTIGAPRVQIPLDVGLKRGYGVQFKAPLICKGENAKLIVSDLDSGSAAGITRYFKGLLPRPSNTSSSDANNLHVKVSATET